MLGEMSCVAPIDWLVIQHSRLVGEQTCMTHITLKRAADCRNACRERDRAPELQELFGTTAIPTRSSRRPSGSRAGRDRAAQFGCDGPPRRFVVIANNELFPSIPSEFPLADPVPHEFPRCTKR
jgi:hypothetical protein